MADSPDSPNMSELIQRAEQYDDSGVLARSLLQAIHSGHIGVWVWQAQTGTMLWNDCMYDIYGLDAASFAGTLEAWSATVHPDDLARVSADVTAALKGERPYNTIFRMVRPDGGIRYLRGTAWVERDEAGKPLRMCGINEDVTERERLINLLAAVQQSTLRNVGDEYFQALVASLVRVLGVRMALVARRLPPELPACCCSMALLDDGRSLPMEYFPVDGSPAAVVLANGSFATERGICTQFPADETLQRSQAEAYLAVALENDSGQHIGYLAVIDDKPMPDVAHNLELLKLLAGRASAELQRMLDEAEILRLNSELERRVGERTAELRRTLKELETFSYSVSHDLRAPLRAISGFVGILQEEYGEGLDETGRDYMRRVVTATDRMGRLIDDLLSLSRISTRNLHLQPVNLGKLAHEILDELEVDTSHPSVLRQIPDNLTAYGDAGLLRLALDNLIGNAWKFSRYTESPLIEMGAEERDGGKEFFIRDNGAGFDAANATKLFAPFQRYHGTDLFPGSGIGLAIVQRIVYRHHGTLRIQSCPDDGATVYFRLPGAAEISLLEAP